MRSIFGWSLPPGVTQRMIDDAAGIEAPCAVCCKAADDCVCPECTVCGEQGNPDCYSGNLHSEPPMKLNKAQIKGREAARVAMLQEQIHATEQYIAWLDDQPDDFKVDISESKDPFA